MAIISCPTCGRSISDRAPTCIHCGGDPRASATVIQSVETGAAPRAVQLDCQACRTPATMQRSNVKRFPWVVRLIGQVILIPSLLGVAFGVLLIIGGLRSHGAVSADLANEAQRTGAAVGLGITMLGGAGIAGSSLVGGLVGWLLLLKRKVWQCTRCGHVLDRA